MASGTINANITNLVATQTKTKSNVTTAAGATGAVTIDITNATWSPLGIVGLKVTNSSSGGAQNSNINVYRWYISGNTAYIYYKNLNASTAAKTDFAVTILYRKNLAAPY